MFTCKIKTGTEWRLPKHPQQVDEQKKEGYKYRKLNFKGRKMNDIKAIKELVRSLKKQYKNITQEEDGEYILIKAS